MRWRPFDSEEFGFALNLAIEVGVTKPLREYVSAGKPVPNETVLMTRGSRMLMMNRYDLRRVWRASSPNYSATNPRKHNENEAIRLAKPAKPSAVRRGWWLSGSRRSAKSTIASEPRLSDRANDQRCHHRGCQKAPMYL
jgi:hypothetical protein